MKTLSKILACIDFSGFSVMTLEYAVRLAKLLDAQIIIYNVINQRDISAVENVASHFPDRINPETFLRDMKKTRLGMAKQMIKEHFFDDKSMMSIIIDNGVPFECILQAIDRDNIDLVVMANKGRSNVSRVLFGSSAEKVFRHSPVPVLSVREREGFTRK